MAEIASAFGEKNYAPAVTEMKEKGVRLLTVISVVPDTIAILREAKKQGLELEVVDLGQQYYDPASPRSRRPTAPSCSPTPRRSPRPTPTPALQVYDKWMDEVGGPKTIAWACRRSRAGLLFATAADVARQRPHP